MTTQNTENKHDNGKLSDASACSVGCCPQLQAHNLVAEAIDKASELLKKMPRSAREEFHSDLKTLALEYHDHGI